MGRRDIVFSIIANAPSTATIQPPNIETSIKQLEDMVDQSLQKVSEDIRGIKTYSEAANPEREQRQPSITGRTNPVAAGSIQRNYALMDYPRRTRQQSGRKGLTMTTTTSREYLSIWV